MIDFLLRTLAILRGRAWYRDSRGRIKWARVPKRSELVVLPASVVADVLRQSEARARRVPGRKEIL